MFTHSSHRVSSCRILILTAPEAERTKPQRQAILIETTSVALSDEHVMLELAGIVEPAEQVVLRTPLVVKLYRLTNSLLKEALSRKRI